MKYVKLLIFWVAFIIISDLGIGHFFVPFFERNFTDGDITEYVKINTLHPYFNHGFKVNATGIRQFGVYRPIIYTNSLGLLDSRIREVQRICNKKRILFMGDSFVEGVGLSYPKTFVGIISQQVDTSRLEILNAGVASFSPKMYFLRTKYLIEQQKIVPTKIFCFMDYSDYGDELVYEDFAPKLQNNYLIVSEWLRCNSILFNFYHWLAKKHFCSLMGISNYDSESFIYWTRTDNNFLKKYPDFLKIRRYWIKSEYKENSTFKHSVFLAESNMDSLKSLCDTWKIKLYVVSYPGKFSILINKEISNYPLKLWENYCASRQIDFISLYDDFITSDVNENRKNVKRYFIPGDLHWNEEGHKIVAKKIAPYIES